MKTQCLVVLTVLLLIAADPLDDAVKKEQQKFQGVWSPVAQEIGGKRSENGNFKKHRWIIEGDRVTIKEATRSRKHSFKLDPSKLPKAIDIFDRQGDLAGRGIYKLEGDILTIAISKPKFDRPTDFVTKKNSHHAVMVLEREKK